MKIRKSNRGEKMDEKHQKQMARMVDSAQPFCDEKIIAAMTCSHAGSMKSVLLSKFLGGGDFSKDVDLPNPVFIAVGPSTIYAFKYKPRGFKFKIKKEVARWPKKEVKVSKQETSMMCYIVLATSSGEHYPLEVPVMMGGRELVHMFLDAFGEVSILE
jgi:hypothetical protein